MTIRDRVRNWLGIPSEVRTHQRRSYAAVSTSRLYGSWTTANTSSNRELRDSLGVLRARARQLERDNPHARRVLRLCEVNVVGPEGIGLQNKAKLPNDETALDDPANRAVEAAWRAWSGSRASSMCGRMNLREQSNLVIRSVVRDGEAFVRKVSNPRGLKLVHIESDLFPETNNRVTDSGQVVMSIEIDRNYRPLMYEMLLTHPGDNVAATSYAQGYEKIAAGSVLHPFFLERVSQSRGAPMLASVMMTLNQLAGYKEAALTSARVGAAQMGFIETATGNELPPDDTTEEDGEGDKIIEVEPGVFRELAAGQKINLFNPPYPTDQYDAFIKTHLREVATGADVSYQALSGDLSGVNYSSIRTGSLEMRDVWRFYQGFIIDSIYTPIFEDWLLLALLFDRLPGYTVEDFDRLNRPTWRVRGWEWVDPLKEQKASIEAIRNGLSSWTLELGKRGYDPEEVFEQIASDRKIAARFGINLDTVTSSQEAPASPVPSGGGDDED